MSKPTIQLGLRENWSQFFLLVVVNAFVGAMIGMERSILPAIAEDEFHLAARTAILSFIVVFGITKALTNYFAGRWSDRFGRKHVLIAGWLVAAPVPFLLLWAPSWSWILAANVLLGVSQGLTWSTTVIMKIDLAGPKNRGLAMGLNEFAGYFAVALSALATGFIASEVGLRPEPFYLGVGFVVLGTLLSVFAVRETRHHVDHESKLAGTAARDSLSQREIITRTSFTDPDLSSVSQAGMVNNLNDGMAWGLFPLVFAAAHMSMAEIGLLAAIYPAVWGLGQLVTGAWSDRVGRKGLIVAGMWTQSAGVVVIALGSSFTLFATGAVLLGLGTAMVYPTLLAAIGDVAHPSWRASAVGVYRLWRDMGYAFGALLAGVVADAFGLSAATLTIAALTFASGIVVAVRMRETLRPEASTEVAKARTRCIEPEALAQTPGAIIIDVRSPDEHAEAHVAGALNIPLDALAQRAAELSRDAVLVTACGKGGGRSEQGATLLRELGFPSVRSLCGGTQAWLAQRPMNQARRRTGSRVPDGRRGGLRQARAEDAERLLQPRAHAEGRPSRRRGDRRLWDLHGRAQHPRRGAERDSGLGAWVRGSGSRLGVSGVGARGSGLGGSGLGARGLAPRASPSRLAFATRDSRLALAPPLPGTRLAAPSVMEPSPILFVDAAGHVTRINEAARARFGLCVGRRCADVVDLTCKLQPTVCGKDCSARLIAKGDGQHEQRGTVRGAPWTVLCSAVGDEVVVVLRPNGHAAGPAERLTAREREILGLVARGLTGHQIAQRLGISRATVRTHVEHCREKLGCRSRAEAVARALALGMLTPP